MLNSSPSNCEAMPTSLPVQITQKRSAPLGIWVSLGVAALIFFSLWTFFYFVYDTAPESTYNIGLINNRTVGIAIGSAGQIGGLLMILIGNVCKCAGYLRQLADESMRRDAVRSAVLAAK